PALLPSAAPVVGADEVLLLSGDGDAVALGLERDAGVLRVLQLAPSKAELTTLPAGDRRWLAGCADARQVGFVAGSGDRVRVGVLRRDGTSPAASVWTELLLSVEHAIDPEHPERDQVRSVCLPGAVLVVARAANDELRAAVCRVDRPDCSVLTLAPGAGRFALLPTRQGALIAYAGIEQPQVRVRTLDLGALTLSPERVPAACWTRGGLCGRPTLARLGQRILLLTPDKTDLLALESADEGQTWSAPPVL
ncbi:MAG TPA: hypothetical protein VFZ61_05725, partial [Polyangiales bacterium]